MKLSSDQVTDKKKLKVAWNEKLFFFFIFQKIISDNRWISFRAIIGSFFLHKIFILSALWGVAGTRDGF